MDVNLRDFPEVVPYLDPQLETNETAQRIERDGRSLLIIRQSSDFEGDEVTFVLEDGSFRPIASSAEERAVRDGVDAHLESVGDGLACVASSAAEQTTLFNHMLTEVNVFDSSAGPDGGNLACVWTVRHIAKKALGRWVTKSDSTTEFGDELLRCYQSAARHEDVAAGGIVISPTVWTPTRKTGHVGFLGAMKDGGSRLIYSNSSSAARFKQNFTVDSWVARYKIGKGLKVHYFTAPNYVPPGPIS